MALKLGYKASAEQFPPRRLLDLAIAAERAGFDSVWTSDHFQPWRHTDGHAPNALVWLGRGRPGDRAGDPRHERAHPVVPVQPGGRRPGVRDARLPGARPGHPRRRDGRVVERDPGRHRLARPERAVRAPEGSRDADPGAVPQGVPHVRRRVLPDEERDDLRPAGGAGPDLHRGLRAGRRTTRRPDRRRDDLHLRQGRGPVHGHAVAGGRRGLPEGGARPAQRGPDDRDEGQLRLGPGPGDGGHQGVGRPGAAGRAEGRASTIRARWSAWPRAWRTSRTGAGWSRRTRTSTSSRSPRTSATGSTTSSSTSRATTRRAAIARYAELILPRLRARFA